MKHTPTPLYAVGNRIFDAEKRETAVATKAHPALRVNAAERAAEIVRACNSHEKHVAQIQHLDSVVRAQAATIEKLEKEKEALLEAAQEVKKGRECLCSGQSQWTCSICMIKKAIALCEGGAE